MMRVKSGEGFAVSPIRAKVRFDFRQNGKPRGLFGRRRPEELAMEERERQLAILQNVPYQGITLEEIDGAKEVYSLPAPDGESEVAYAPVEMTVRADSIEDLIAFTLREELRKIKIVEPEEMILTNYDVERALFRMSEEYRDNLEHLAEF
ncbi:MAG TPA: hypothetical protein PLI94_08635 [Bacillota bacterium]|jgi:hypothetical protein|nr:hypothetical protein [Bacillota bacterium]HPT68087.1 hypothetical protein [Bacillota bacterium]